MKLTKQAPKPSPQEEEEEREQGVGVRMAPADIDSSRNENIQNEEDVFRAEAEIVGGDSPLSQDDLTRYVLRIVYIPIQYTHKFTHTYTPNAENHKH